MSTLTSLTDQLENAELTNSNGYPNNDAGPPAYTLPFYVDSSGLLNFGYGVVVPAGTTTAINNLRSTVENLLEESSVSQTSIDEVNNFLGGTASVQQINSSLQSQDWRPFADAVEIGYYAEVTIPDLESRLGQGFYNLDASAQEGLELLDYNAGPSFLGSKNSSIRYAIQTQNYQQISYQLAFNTAKSSNLAYNERSVLGAALTLGFDPDIGSNNLITSLTDSQVNNNVVRAFLQEEVTNDPVSFLSSTPVTALLTQIEQYGITQGYYVVQNGDSSVSNIAAFNAANISGISGGTLQQIIADLNELPSISAAVHPGQTLIVPLSLSPIYTPTLGNEQTLSTSGPIAYYIDLSGTTPYLSTVATVVSGLTPGALEVVNGSGKLKLEAQSGAVTSVALGAGGSVNLNLPGNHVLTANLNGTFAFDGKLVTSVDKIGITLHDDPQVVIDVDFTTGSSTLISYNVGSGPETITGYSESDGTGLPTDQIDNSADGTSIVTTYLDSGSASVTDYTGPNGTGTAETSDYQGLFATYNWQGGEGDFGDASQWLDESLSPPASDYAPGSSSFVEFENGGQVGGSGAAETITVDSPVTFTGTVQTTSFTNNDQIDVQGTLLTNSIDGGDATVEGTIDAASGGFGSLDVKSGGDVETGVGAVTGNVIIEAGGTFNDDETTIGGANGTTSTFKVDGADASWSSGEAAVIGDNDGSAEVTISDGAFADLPSGFGVGFEPTTASGSNSLTIASGAVVDVDATGAASDVEADSNHSGSITVEGAGSELYSPQSALTVYGQASFSLLSGATTTVVDFEMNDLSGDGAGSSTIDGPQTDLSTIILGIDDGTLTISNIAQLTLGGVIASSGNDTPATGDTFLAIIGNTGTGMVDVQAGATITADPNVTTGSFELSGMAGSEGILTVSGAGSLVDLGQGIITVGAFGNGTLAISDGGGLDAASVILGDIQGGQGQVSVAGQSSYLSVDALLALGGLANSAGQASLAISDNAIVDASDVDVGATGSITLSSGELDTDPVTVETGGNISGNGLVSGDIDNSGTITASGGTLELTDAITGSGTLVIDPYSTLLLDGPIDTDVTIEFASGGTGTLELSDPADFQGLIVGQAPGDQVVDVACFLRGTSIATPAGQAAVETLAIGDLVLTASGATRPIKWIGRRSYIGRLASRNQALWPIRFRADSLGNDLPRRDLWVSGDHALYLDGLLIPARQLVNDVTITRERPIGELQYFHIELETHDVLLAEGAPAESFLDDDSRRIFHNAAEFAVLYPEAGPPGRFCAPRVEDGYELEAVRCRLDALAGGQQLAA